MRGSRTDARRRRHARARKRIAGTARRPRLAVFRSNRHIYAQVIDDDTGTTLAAASTTEAGMRDHRLTTEAAGEVGKLIAVRAKDVGVDAVLFDRGGSPYHGRVEALAEAARKVGLKF